MLMLTWVHCLGYVINVPGASIRATFFLQIILKAECFGCSSKSVCCRNSSVGLPGSLFLKIVLVSFGSVGKGKSAEPWQDFDLSSLVATCSQLLPYSVSQHPSQPLDISANSPSLLAPYCCSPWPAVPQS